MGHPILDFSDFEEVPPKSFILSGCRGCLNTMRTLLSSCFSYIYATFIINCFSACMNCTSYTILPYMQRTWIQRNIFGSNIYLVVLVVMIMYLYFGSFISDLYCPYGYQFIFDIIGVIVFLFLMTDIVLRCLAEENYFKIHFPWLSYLSGVNGLGDLDTRSVSSAGSGFGASSVGGFSSTVHTEGGTDVRRYFSGISFGSVYFWSDLISTLTILFEISWINPNAYGEIIKDIILNSSNNTWTLPKETKEIEEFVYIIGQTLRLSRLVGIMIKHKIYNL